uniref:Uncharacterized protein n=1 Tax=Cacopsylla melanoneura TaxID=428564 RepID=A0A8D9DR30_9HEMI
MDNTSIATHCPNKAEGVPKTSKPRWQIIAPAKDFLFKNTDKIYKLSEYYFPEYVKYMYKYVMTDAEMKEIQEFVSKNNKYLKDSKTYLKEYEDAMKQNIIWQKDNYKEIADYLTANVKP